MGVPRGLGWGEVVQYWSKHHRPVWRTIGPSLPVAHDVQGDTGSNGDGSTRPRGRYDDGSSSRSDAFTVAWRAGARVLAGGGGVEGGFGWPGLLLLCR